ncbi:MAG: hypothetical protein GY950_34570 [bacterium]|nr:hypothetical protein [bacterium]
MKHFRIRFQWVLVFLFIFTVSAAAADSAKPGGQQKEIVIAMCRPALGQVKNIEQLYEKDIITLDKIKLIGVYHEDESTDYQPAIEYVEENKLSWVTFETIKGEVDIKDLFKRNKWTDQFRAIFDRTDGIIFTGGEDIPPAVFGEEHNLLTAAGTPNRTLYETSYLFHLLGGSRGPQFVPFLESRKDYVVLAICLGAQTMNVATGGTLYQDIPSQVYGFKTVQQVLKAGREKVHSSRYIKALHPLEPGLPPVFHRIKILKGGFYVKRMKMKTSHTPYILTSHHQAIKDLGKGLKVAAVSMDGKIVETVEHREYKNVLGVQFHPEFYPLYLKGRFYREKPGGPLDLNLRQFLNTHGSSMLFHKAIWQWFSDTLRD